MKTNKMIKLIGVCYLLAAGSPNAFTQSTMFTYQGRVLDNGTNFNGTGQFEFALVTSTNTSSTATATADLSGQFVISYNVTFGGSGYVTAPAVTVSGGGGSGAAAHAVLSGGVVTNVVADNAGSGYSSAPTVTIAAPPVNLAYTTFWSNDGTSMNGSEPAAAVAIGVSNGLFTVILGDSNLANMAPIDASLFTQPNLQLLIWFNDGVNGFSVLNPAQNLTPEPYAITAENLNGTVAGGELSGTYGNAVTFNNSANSFFGIFVGDGSGVSNAAAATLGGLSTSNFWQTSGNAGTTPGTNFLGTTDNQPLQFRTANSTVLQLIPTTNTVNLVAGDSHNFVAPGVYGATIGGGGTLAYPGGTGLTNSVLANFATIGGGVGNTASGAANYSGGDSATVAGGWFNSAVGNNAAVAGGAQNLALADNSAVGGGAGNIVQSNASVATIGGGSGNTIFNGGFNATINGGYGNGIGSPWATIGGGGYHSIGTNSNSGTISGGYAHTIKDNSFDCAIGGGSYSTIGTNSYYSTIAGGRDNSIGDNATSSVIGGGYFNQISNGAPYAVVPGGYYNYAAGAYSFAAGNSAQANHAGAFVWADDSSATAFTSTISNQFNVRATGGVRFVTGGTGLTLDGPLQANSFAGDGYNLVGLNADDIYYGTVNDALLSANVPLLTGSQNFSGLNTFSGGVQFNNVVQIGNSSSDYLHIEMGGGNSYGFLYGSYARFGDGIHLSYNYYANAAGDDAIPVSAGATSRVTVGYGQIVLAVGGVDAAPTTQRLLANSSGVTVNGTFNNSSDRNAKQDFAPINALQILAEVTHLPLSEWSYKEDPKTRHVGPMGQDFYAAFNIGTDEKHIAPIDEGGVALAAIQGLNKKVDDKDAVIQQQSQEIAGLKARLEKLEQLINLGNGGTK